MKKIFALAVLGIMAVTAANAEYVELHTDNCDINSMRAELNRAVVRHHAVITKIVCDSVIETPVEETVESVENTTCGEPFEKVVNREYFVRETVQQYRPVVSYVPDETYTTMRPVCGEFGC